MNPILPPSAATPGHPPPAPPDAPRGEDPIPPSAALVERLLILVKHSLPDIDPRLPPHAWRLGEEGRKRCAPLADRLAPYSPSIVVTSDEPKAAETGADLARRLHRQVRTAPALHEHDRRQVAFLGNAAFEGAVERFFARPNELVFGRETAQQAGSRFAAGLDHLLVDHRDGNVAVVTHGTVISLFVAAHADVDPFNLWRRHALPSFVVLRLPTCKLATIVESVVPAGADERVITIETALRPNDRFAPDPFQRRLGRRHV